MNSIYLYIHRVMIRHTINPKMEMSRKEAVYYISRFNFPKHLRYGVLREMVKLKLLERVNRDIVKIINKEKSEKMELNNR